VRQVEWPPRERSLVEVLGRKPPLGGTSGCKTVPRQAHNLKVTGSNPVPATTFIIAHPPSRSDAPLSRTVKRAGHILCRPVLGGLHHDRAMAPRYTLWCESLAAPGSSSPAFLLPLDNGGPVPLALLRGNGDQGKSLAGAAAASSRAGHAAAHRQPDAHKQIAAGSIDAVERGHDISRTVDPGHCSGARL
jgi:hypothetical protein